MKKAINTTIRGTFTVKACNAGTLDEKETARQNTYHFPDKTDTLLLSATYTLHVETAGGAADYGFLSLEKAKAVAELLWNASTADRIRIINDDTAEVLYLYEVELPF